MSQNLNQAGAYPARVNQKATERLEAYMRGDIVARKLAGNQGYAIEVGYRWRLLCRESDDRFQFNAWLLCSHEIYNRLTKGTFH
ncbi:TPA: hypothetical protein LU109_003592 [Enterobacter hormaechei subsp. xiangfangensis]|nr:hypothetical protein [Enterobacter hormaechei subsp. xiangfangensis]